VILSWVLYGARLATNGIGGLDAGGGAMLYGKSHTFHNGGVGFGSHLGMTFREIALVLRVLMDMGHIIPASVGDGDGEVAELQRGAGDITLTHACPPDGLAIPAVLITAVQVVGTCQKSTLFALDINVHRTAQAHRLHVGAPGGDRLIVRGIHEVVVDHRGESHEKPGVARLRQCLFQIEGRAVLMTAHLDITISDARVTLHGGSWGDDAFREQGECLGSLEGGARGVWLADGLTHIAAIRRVGGETKDLAIGGIDSHNAARLMPQ